MSFHHDQGFVSNSSSFVCAGFSRDESKVDTPSDGDAADLVQ
jgi:hypothetical protein